MDALKKALLELHKEIKARTPHNSGGFGIMLQGPESGAELARKIILTDSIHYGFDKMVKYDRLHLTVEALIVEHPEWHPLVGADAVKMARAILETYGYEPKA